MYEKENVYYAPILNYKDLQIKQIKVDLNS